MMLPVRSMTFALLFSGSSTAAAVAIQPSSSAGDMLQICNESDALLKVSFTIDQTGWDNIYHEDDDYTWYKPELSVHPSGNIGNSTLIRSVKTLRCVYHEMVHV